MWGKFTTCCFNKIASRKLAPLTKPKLKSLAAVGMSQRRLVSQRHKFFSQLQPAPQTRRRVRRASGPANACQRSPDIEVGRVLPNLEKRDAGSFRKGQLEVARFGKSDQHFTDQRRPFPMIQKLAVARLPVRRRADELMDRSAA